MLLRTHSGRVIGIMSILAAAASLARAAPAAGTGREFLEQKSFDPWVLTTTDPAGEFPAYLGNGFQGSLFGRDGRKLTAITAGRYVNGAIVEQIFGQNSPLTAADYKQSVDMRTGELTTSCDGITTRVSIPGVDWTAIWKSGDIAITGDPEAQQVVHANLFYLLSSIAQGSINSIPPLGLSSPGWAGHIFWDAEIWMMPALLPQFADRAKSMIDYRFNRLGQAKQDAVQHGYAGAEFPWESAETGKEEAPAPYCTERHITADVAYGAWLYYLWTGDKTYLANEGWPILKACAEYWVTRASKGPDEKYHISKLVGPDEYHFNVDDDAWTNGVVAYTLRAASAAAPIIGASANPEWLKVANNLVLLFDESGRRYIEYAGATDKLLAKQADTQMLIYPLDASMTREAAQNTLDYYLVHTDANGPAMTSCIDAIVAAKLGRSSQSLDLFRKSYRPFMRSGLCTFSETPTNKNVYLCTGMGGCLQTVIYGFAGLNVAWGDHIGKGHLIARSGNAALFADPHLPPGWSSITLKGVRFRGSSYTITIDEGNEVHVMKNGLQG